MDDSKSVDSYEFICGLALLSQSTLKVSYIFKNGYILGKS